MRKIVNKIIRRLGREGYNLDKNLTNRSLVKVLISKFIQAFRGFFFRIRLKKSEGLLFLGKGTEIKFKNLISVGNFLTIGSKETINVFTKK